MTYRRTLLILVVSLAGSFVSIVGIRLTVQQLEINTYHLNCLEEYTSKETRRSRAYAYFKCQG